jgi:hypothetical protein
MRLELLDEKDKLNILLNLLNERYRASHSMRERAIKFALWILGFVAVAVPWLLLYARLCVGQKVTLTILAVLLTALAILFLHGIHAGFKNNRNLLIKIEAALGCYEKGFFVTADQLYPEEYRVTKPFSLKSHFQSIYILLILAAIITIISIWLTF